MLKTIKKLWEYDIKVSRIVHASASSTITELESDNGHKGGILIISTSKWYELYINYSVGPVKYWREGYELRDTDIQLIINSFNEGYNI